MPAPPLATSACTSWEPEELPIPKDKTISKDNTHRIGERKEHNPIYALGKLRYQRDKKLGINPSQSSVVKCQVKDSPSLPREKKNKENSNKCFL